MRASLDEDEDDDEEINDEGEGVSSMSEASEGTGGEWEA